jgi:hypothetical protein
LVTGVAQFTKRKLICVFVKNCRHTIVSATFVA